MLVVDHALAQRLEDAQTWRAVRYALAQAKLKPESGSAAEAMGDGYAVFAGATSPANGVRGLGMRGPVAPALLEQVEDFYSRRGCPTRIHVCPLADRSLLALLRERAYRLDEFQSVLARPLDDSLLAYQAPPHVSIAEVGLDQADLWLQVSAQGFSGQDEPPAAVFEVLGPNMHSEGAVRLLAYVDGDPAGAAAAYINQGVAELGGASTRPAFRRHGVHGALLLARLAAARRLGCDLAEVGTSPGSVAQRNSERAGFAVAYTRVIVVR